MLGRILTFQFKPRIEHLILHVTSRCNLDCRTCFVPKNHTDLPLQQVHEVARTLESVTWLDIGGGEPFLRDDLPEICSIMPTDDITIPTNGMNPADIEAKAKKIRANCDCEVTIAVSLDGFEEVNDEIRGKGSFLRAVETINRLTKIKHLTTKVNTVICQRNFSQLLPFMEFVRSLEPKYHSLLLLRGQARDTSYRLPSTNELCAAKDDFLSILRTYPYHNNPLLARIGRNYHRLLWDLSLRALREGRQPIPCLAGQAHLVVFANGDVTPCELKPPVGNLLKANLEEICRSETMLSSIEHIRKGCCHCTHNCNMVDNILLNSHMYLPLIGLRSRV